MKLLGLNYLSFFIIRTFIVAFIGITGSNQSYSSSPIIEESIIARVNNKVITSGQLARFTRRFPQFKDKPNEALQILMEKHLFRQAAEKEEIKITDEELERIIKQRIEKIGGREKFEAEFLTPLNMSYAEYREEVYNEILIQRYIMKKRLLPYSLQTSSDFLIDTFITPQEIHQYWKCHQTEFSQWRIKTRQIILLFDDPISKEMKRSLGEAIIHELSRGADFTALAYEYTEVNRNTGGLWEWTPRGTFPPKVEEVIFNLKIGEITPLIETENSYRIIRVEDKIEPIADINSPAVQERIQTILFAQKLAQGQAELIKKLLKQADVWVDPKLNFTWSFPFDQ